MRGDSKLNIQNNAQRQSPRPMFNKWHYFRHWTLPLSERRDDQKQKRYRGEDVGKR